MGVFEQAFGFARHVTLFEVIDHARELLAARLGDIDQDARLGDAPEIAVDGRPPSCRHEIETNGPDEQVAMDAILALINDKFGEGE